MGRVRNQIIWRHYQELEDKSVKCTFCEKHYKKGHVIKMTRHLLNCFKCPQAVKEEIIHPQGGPTTQSRESSTTSMVNIKNTSSGISELREEFSKALLITGIPLSMVEHPLWITFFEKLNFKLPNRKLIATKHLEKIYKEMHKQISEDIMSSSFLHLQCDGWTDICNEGIINFVISKPEPVFIKSLNTLDNRHTSEYLSCEIEKVINFYDVNKLVVLIGDNARNVQKSFEIIKNKYRHIVPLNCAAHTLNLLCLDLLKPPEINDFISLATDVIKNITKNQVISAVLSKIRKEKTSSQSLKLPCKTIWGSHITALQSLKINKSALQTLAINEQQQPTPDMKSTLLDEDFWCMLDQCINILKPVVDSIFKLEGNKFNIHEVFMVLRDLKSKLDFLLPSTTMLDTESKEYIKTSIQKRVKQCLKPIHYAAYMLDPKSTGIKLDYIQETEAMEFICNLAEHCNIDCLADLAQYKGKKGLWGKSFTWKVAEKVSPILWWKGICGSSQLSKIALRILTAPCTSALTKKIISKQGFIHNAKRNRMTSERAAKVTFISHNWNLIHKCELKSELNDDDSYENIIVQDDNMIHHSTIKSEQDLESSLTENLREDGEPIPSTSQGTTNFEFISFREEINDSDTN